jgi:hypothetical protein
MDSIKTIPSPRITPKYVLQSYNVDFPASSMEYKVFEIIDSCIDAFTFPNPFIYRLPTRY